MRKSQLEQETAFWEKKRIEVISEMAQVHRITSKKERDTARMNTAMKIADVYDKVQLVSLEINKVRKQYDAVEELRTILIDKETEKIIPIQIG